MLVPKGAVLVSRGGVGLFELFFCLALPNGSFVSLLGCSSSLVYLGFWPKNLVFRCLVLGVRLCSVARMDHYFGGFLVWVC